MLGILWTVLNPLLNMIVMVFVFSMIFGRQNMALDYPVYVLCGNIVFGFMRMATTGAMSSIVAQRDLLNKTKVNQFVFPTAKVFSSLVNFGFSMIALVLVMVVRILSHAEVAFHWTMLLTIAPFLPALILFSWGLSLILCVVYVYFRDIAHFYNVFLTLWVYATPIFYSLDSIKLTGKKLMLMTINPMYHYVTYFRELIMGNVPDLNTHLIVYAWGIGMFLVGLLFFKLKENKLILHL